jgi:hypothetical protein
MLLELLFEQHGRRLEQHGRGVYRAGCKIKLLADYNALPHNRRGAKYRSLHNR